jgi:hypothetical protein
MRRIALFVATALFAAACRTASPRGNESALAPIAAPSIVTAFSELQNRRTHFAGERSLMRIHATTGGGAESFRAQLQVDGGGRMQLTAYTPIGTTALTLFSDGRSVVFLNSIENTAWRGSAAEFARAFGFFGPLSPPDMAMLLLGLPAQSGTTARMLADTTFGTAPGMIYDVTPTGLARASIETDDDLVIVSYDPPTQPPKHVKVNHGRETLDIEHLETVASDEILTAPEIPASYRCCVVPRLP